MPRRGHQEETALVIEDEVLIIPPPTPAHRTSAFVKILLNISPHYDRLKTKRPYMSLMLPLKCENHPF